MKHALYIYKRIKTRIKFYVSIQLFMYKSINAKQESDGFTQPALEPAG